MLIKVADDKLPQLQALEALLHRSDVGAATRRRIETEVRNVRAGASGEADAAYQIEFDHGKSRNRMTIHDLRLEVDGRVAQIDHVIINRLLDIYVCESKHFAEGVAINDQGEWEAFRGSRRYGIPSPVEQNRRHIAVLSDVFKSGLVKLPRRLGLTIKPSFKSLILVSNGARISRPSKAAAARIDGIDTVIKVEQLLKALDRDFDSHSDFAMAKVVSSDTIERLARDLAALHIPATVDWTARFGLATQSNADSPDRPPLQLDVAATTVCESCGRELSPRVVDYCRANVDRLGGRMLCYDCQRRRGARAS